MPTPTRLRSKPKPTPHVIPPVPTNGSVSSIEAALMYFLMEAPNHALKMTPQYLADAQAQRKDFDFVQLVQGDGSIILTMVMKHGLQADPRA